MPTLRVEDEVYTEVLCAKQRKPQEQTGYSIHRTARFRIGRQYHYVIHLTFLIE